MQLLDTVKFTDNCYFDIVTIFDGGECEHFMPDPLEETGDFPTWEQVFSESKIAKRDFFYVLAENQTSGFLLNFGNHLEFREKNLMQVVGETIGYV